MKATHIRFTTEIHNYLDDKGLEHLIQDGTYTIHIKVKNVTKKFWLEVLLPEMRIAAKLNSLEMSGSTFFSDHIYIRFFGGR